MLRRLFGRRDGNGRRYDEIVSWRYVERAYRSRTHGGFFMHYTLKGLFDCVDREAFKAARLLDENNRQEKAEEIFDVWHNQIFVRAMRDSCFALDFANEVTPHKMYPKVFAWRKNGGDIRQPFVYDPSALELLKATNSLTQQGNWHHEGCAVQLMAVEGNVTPADIKENSAMLTPEHIRKLEKSDPLSTFREVASARAFELQQNLKLEEEYSESAKREQTVTSAGITIKTYGVGTDQHIEWKKSAEFQKDRYEVLGFRRSGQFSDDPLNEAENGIRIVHSCQNGTTVNQLDSENVHYYTFFLKDSKNGRKCCWVRFTVTMPSASSRPTLSEALLQKSEPSRHEKKLEELLANLTHERKRVITVVNWRSDAQREIEDDETLTPKQKREQIKMLDEIVARVENRS